MSKLDDQEKVNKEFETVSLHGDLKIKSVPDDGGSMVFDRKTGEGRWVPNRVCGC